ncbi:MAG: hypothetical protein AAF548_12270 [Actinomycetota bacterium]
MEFSERIAINGVEYDDLDAVPEPDRSRIRTILESSHQAIEGAAGTVDGGTITRTFSYKSRTSDVKSLNDVDPVLRETILADEDGDGVPDIFQRPVARSDVQSSASATPGPPAVAPLAIAHEPATPNLTAIWIALAIAVAFLAGLVLGSVLS